MRPDYDAVLVTCDADLRAAVLAERPVGVRVLCVDPHEVGDYASIRTRRWWIDLDSAEPLPTGSQARCDYFCQQRAQAPKSLQSNVLVRDTSTGDFPSMLWSRLEPVPLAPPAQGLPEWSLDLQEVELPRLLRNVVTHLPHRLGYEEILIYLVDRQLQTLRLAKSNVRSDVMLEIPLDGPAVLAAAVRREQIVSDGRTLLGNAATRQGLGADESLLTLRHGDAVLGCVHLRRHRRPRTALPDVQLLGLTRLLGKLVAHAQAYERVRNEARIDALTGLYNQRWMNEAASREVLRARRYGTPLSMLMIDLDALKQTNDLHGHRAGDDLLRYTAERVRSCLRQIDAAARTGGDEFVVLLPRTDATGATYVANRIRNALRDCPPLHQGRALSARASIGVTQWQPGQDAEALLDAADSAMYAAKQAGGDRVSQGVARAARPEALAATVQKLRS